MGGYSLKEEYHIVVMKVRIRFPLSAQRIEFVKVRVKERVKVIGVG